MPSAALAHLRSKQLSPLSAIVLVSSREGAVDRVIQQQFPNCRAKARTANKEGL